MKKKIYLVHGWGGSDSSEGWFGWLKEECYRKGIDVISFNMPNTDEPKIEEWVNYLRENVTGVNENTYLIGHSIGCQTILRFLEKLPKHKRVAGCVFVAPWLDLINMNPEEMTIAHPWINSEINFDRIKYHTNNFLALFSDDDPYVHINEVEKFRDRLGAKIIIKHKEKHFNETEKISEILKFIHGSR